MQLFHVRVAQIKKEDADHKKKLSGLDKDIEHSNKILDIQGRVSARRQVIAVAAIKAIEAYEAEVKDLATKESELLDGEYKTNSVAAGKKLKEIAERRKKELATFLAAAEKLVQDEEKAAAEVLATIDAALKDLGDPNTVALLKKRKTEAENDLKGVREGGDKRLQAKKDAAEKAAKSVDGYRKSVDDGENEMQRCRNHILALKAAKSSEEDTRLANEKEQKAKEAAEKASRDAKASRLREEGEIEAIRKEIREREERERQARIQAELKRKQEEEERIRKAQEEQRRLKEEQERRERERRNRCPSGMHAWNQYCFIVNAPWGGQAPSGY